jgi:hypothetical protein
MLCLGVFFISYGIKGGFIEKKILVNAWRQEYVSGRGAQTRGWFYIIVGIIFIVVLVSVIIDTLRR